MNQETIIIKLFGPPGTGKTTALVQEMVALKTSGVWSSWDEIAIMSFSRATAAEFLHRIHQREELANIEGRPYCKTIHAICYQLLGLKDVMKDKDYEEFGRHVGMAYETEKNGDELLSSLLEDPLEWWGEKPLNQWLWLVNLNRVADNPDLLPWSLARISQPDRLMSEARSQKLWEAFVKWKHNAGKLDFTDMMMEVQAAGLNLPDSVQVIIFDEAQDSTPLQWNLIRRWVSGRRCWIMAGDDDQALYQWGGAEVGEFLDQPYTEQIVLPQSYRVPRRIYRLADQITSRIRSRVKKAWSPRDCEGSILYQDLADWRWDGKSSWLILGRNRLYVYEMIRQLDEMGVPWRPTRGRTPIHQFLNLIQAIQHIKAGAHPTRATLGEILKSCNVQGSGLPYGFKTPFLRQLAEMPEEEQAQAVSLKGLGLGKFEAILLTRPVGDIFTKYRQSLQRLEKQLTRYGEEAVRNPLVRVGTIHSAKGMEADHVYIDTSQTKRTWEGELTDPDSARRVWYVAVTRARESVVIGTPINPKYATEILM